MRERFDKKSGLAFLSKFSTIQNKTIGYGNAGVATDSEQGQDFAKEFWQMLTEFTGGDMNILPQLMKMVEVKTDNTEWQQKQEIFSAFLEPALEAYFSRLEINPFEVKND